MLERLSPVTLSNGGTYDDSNSNVGNGADEPDPMEVCMVDKETPQEPETKLDESDKPTATSKAVEELVKMVNKLSESMPVVEEKNNEIDLEKETLDAVNSILNVSDKSIEDEHMMDVSASNNVADDDCTTID